MPESGIRASTSRDAILAEGCLTLLDPAGCFFSAFHRMESALISASCSYMSDEKGLDRRTPHASLTVVSARYAVMK